MADREKSDSWSLFFMYCAPNLLLLDGHIMHLLLLEVLVNSSASVVSSHLTFDGAVGAFVSFLKWQKPSPLTRNSNFFAVFGPPLLQLTRNFRCFFRSKKVCKNVTKRLCGSTTDRRNRKFGSWNGLRVGVPWDRQLRTNWWSLITMGFITIKGRNPS